MRIFKKSTTQTATNHHAKEKKVTHGLSTHTGTRAGDTHPTSARVLEGSAISPGERLVFIVFD